jgi:hypothetical protein
MGAAFMLLQQHGCGTHAVGLRHEVVPLGVKRLMCFVWLYGLAGAVRTVRVAAARAASCSGGG